MDRFSGTVAVVTGSSVGIGAAITKTLLKRGLIVAGVARREDKLKVSTQHTFIPILKIILKSININTILFAGIQRRTR